MLATNQLVRIDVDHGDVKPLKAILYATFNKQHNFKLRPGQYNMRFLPEKNHVRYGNRGRKTRMDTLKKHAVVIKSLTIIKSSDIKRLDEPFSKNGTSYTLRSLLHDLTFPLIPESESSPSRPLFHTMDYPSNGPDAGKNVIYFTAYHNRAETAERLVEILPAFIHFKLGMEAVKEWCYPESLQTVHEVTFSYDNDGNWDGTWSTAEDEVADVVLDEDMDVKIEVENLLDIQSQLVLLTSDDASVGSFGSVSVAHATTPSQQKEAASPAEDLAVAGNGDGAAE